MGLVYGDIGQPQKALEFYDQALNITKEVGNRSGEANTLSNIGTVYDKIGQPQKALEYYNQALPIKREVGNRSGEATTLNNLGAVYGDIGQPEKALEHYNQALLIAREVGNRSGEATTLNNLGLDYHEIGNFQKALEYYEQALPLKREVGDRSGEAITLNNLGGVYDKSGQPQKALNYYNQALSLINEVDDPFGTKNILNNLGFIHRDMKQPTEAIAEWEKSLTISLEIRQGLLQEDRQSYIESVNRIAIALTDLLIDQNQPQKAFEWINRVTTFELVDYNRLINAKVSNPEAQKALDDWKAKQLQLQALRQKLQDNYSLNLVEQIQKLDSDIKTETENNIKRFPELAERMETTPEDITRLQETIPTGTIVIQPVLLTNAKKVPNSIALFILSKNNPIQVKKIPIADPKAFEDLIVDYREILSNRGPTGYRDKGGELYDYLIRPIESEIQALSPNKIAIIATGKLRYIPFEALWDSQANQYLIEKYPIHYYTRLSVNSLISAKPNPKSIKVLALGNPILQEPYLLPSTEVEVKAIPPIFTDSEIYLNHQATRQNFQRLALRFSYLHLATHACFEKEGCCLRKKDECVDGKKDMDPNTVLFADGQFNLANTADLNLGETELVILSACQTALKEDSDGNEISGIAYNFEQAGAKSVIASLWSADDEATQEIMIQFYKNLQQGMNKADALHQAKLAQKARHPFLWSPFILIGNGE